MAAQEESGRSYLSKLSPWARSPTVAPSKGKEGEPETAPLQQQKGADHVISHRHRLSLRRYPRDCPRLRPQWFHAVDIPKRRPNPSGVVKDEKPPGIPKKYAAFSTTDSKSIETAFQRLLEEEDAGNGSKQHDGDIAHGRSDGKPNMSLRDRKSSKTSIKVPVNEDYLFDVDVEKRELGPAYWHGPVYDVRRGTWFYQDGNVQRPCDENLAAQLEEGYLKVKAWKLPPSQRDAPTKPRSASQPRSRPVSWTPGQDIASLAEQTVSAKGSSSDLRKKAVEDSASGKAVDSVRDEHSQNTYRLFGAHMNSVVTYQDGTTAWLLTDDWMTRMNYTVYQRFTTGFAGIKITRGWVDPDQKKDVKDDKATKTAEDKIEESSTKQKGEDVEESKAERVSTSENMRQTLQRQMSALMEDSGHSEDRAKQEEEARKRDEREIEDDYRETEGDEQGREIEHLILVTHGIGQRLGLRLESVNFVHDVNTLRKTIKAVYAESPDLRALNAELDGAESVNSRVQVLPICWRHLLDFPRQSLRHNRKEHDLGDTDIDEEAYPNLEDITLEGVPFARQLIGDLALDILLYDSPAYKDHISGLVLSELNRIYHLFMERNPKFDGKISFVGHSLGSAIMFDILCKQDQPPKLRGEPSFKLDFPVEDFYALGSPIGLFQMLNGRTIVARQDNDRRDRAGSNGRIIDDSVLGGTSKKQKDSAATHVQGENPVARPKCDQIFNIFHPTDPISYRIEPLISPAMASLKPQPLPYTKRGLFGAPVGQGLTGIGTRVSSSVSSMWTSMASSLLTRGLGYGEDATKAGVVAAKSSVPLSKGKGTNAPSTSSGAGTNVTAGVIPRAPLPAKGTEITPIDEDKVHQVATDAQASHNNQLHPPTLIDNEITTLYGDFEKRRKPTQSDADTRDLGAGATRGNPEWAEAEERGKRLRREEEKVRKLNSNGRVDYAIQEGAFDINLIAAIASHLSYWSDEDVSHFIISQLLSRHRVVRSTAEGAGSSNPAGK
ncbi:putative DDHD domain, alpha/Beta hydrolase [Septoria linicola]|nr:putative DDHD domain, alpha/Beta hydrolase [Septoria linicola]